MKRIFNAEKGTDLLINEYTKITGVKIGKIFNSAVYCWFLPETETLNAEATYILHEEEKGTLDQWTIKQCISRGITWLSKYPIENCKILRSILLHFTCAPYRDDQKDTRNDVVKEMFDKAEEKIKEYDQSYCYTYFCMGNFGEDICDHWKNVWNEKVMYDVISSIVYLQEPQKPFTWYEAIEILKCIEEEAKEKYGLK